MLYSYKNRTQKLNTLFLIKAVVDSNKNPAPMLQLLLFNVMFYNKIEYYKYANIFKYKIIISNIFCFKRIMNYIFIISCNNLF